MSVDFSRSLEQLENCDWGEPKYDLPLVIECHELRKVPLQSLTGDQICTLIGQDIGAEHLVPLALTYLTVDPLADQDYFPGSIISSIVVGLTDQFWLDHPKLHGLITALANEALGQLNGNKSWDSWYPRQRLAAYLGRWT